MANGIILYVQIEMLMLFCNASLVVVYFFGRQIMQNVGFLIIQASLRGYLVSGKTQFSPEKIPLFFNRKCDFRINGRIQHSKSRIDGQVKSPAAI